MVLTKARIGCILGAELGLHQVCTPGAENLGKVGNRRNAATGKVGGKYFPEGC